MKGTNDLTQTQSLMQYRSRPWWKRYSRVGAGLILTALLIWKLGGFDTSQKSAEGVVEGGERKKQSWDEFKPSKDVTWHRCYDGLDCARLEVPLDWKDPSDARRATLAIMKYNATNLTSYAGPMFINPGGPGGSGLWFIRHLGKYYQSVVGNNHDIISFDPRFVGHTTPQLLCFNSSLSRTSPFLWDLQEPPVLDAHSGALYEAYAHAQAYSQQCASMIGDLGRFVSTASTARDLLEIMEKIAGKEAKLRYWGFSYGTFLGVTFASLWPDRIERMVLDGNVDANQLVTGTKTHYLTDTDKVWSFFATYCHAAGPEACSFYSPTPELITSHVDSILEKLRHHPVVVPSSASSPLPKVVTYSDIRKMISTSLYQPLIIFPQLAKVLSGLDVGNGQPFVDLRLHGKPDLPLCHGEDEPPYPDPDTDANWDAGKAILCTDSEKIEGGVEEFEEYLKVVEKKSKAAGATMARMRIECVGWGIEAKWRFAGPFGGNTSHPILFVNNIGDPVTPLINAQDNSKIFPGSGILIQDSYGHISLSSPSSCTAQKIGEYFQSGELPPVDTHCAPNSLPFQSSNSTVSKREENQLDRALSLLMNVVPIPKF